MSREKTADPFLEKAKSLTKLPPATSHCWTMVKRGIGAGMLPESELVGLIKDLEQQKDCILDELAFEFIDGRLRIRLLDDQDFCEPELMLSVLNRLKSPYLT